MSNFAITYDSIQGENFGRTTIQSMTLSVSLIWSVGWEIGMTNLITSNFHLM